MAFISEPQLPSLSDLFGQTPMQPSTLPEVPGFAYDQPIPGVRPASPTPIDQEARMPPDDLAGARAIAMRPPEMVRQDISRLFWELRRHLGVSQHDLARRLGTDVHTLAALEAAQVSGLPQWPETARVVRAYLEIVGVDATPVLVGLRTLMRDEALVIAPVSLPLMTLSDRLKSVQAAAMNRTGLGRGILNRDGNNADRVGQLGNPPLRRKTDKHSGRNIAASWLSFLRKAWRQPNTEAKTLGKRPSWRFAYLGGCLAALIIVATLTPGWGAMSQTMPEPVGHAMRQVQDFVLLRFAEDEDGMPLIDVGDPRSRKHNKLGAADQ